MFVDQFYLFDSFMSIVVYVFFSSVNKILCPVAKQRFPNKYSANRVCIHAHTNKLPITEKNLTVKI